MHDREYTPAEKKRFAKIRALTIATKLIALPANDVGLAYEFEANQFTSEKDRAAIRKELEMIRWQLINRLIKLEKKVFGE